MKKITKIIVGIIAFTLIGGLLWFANAFVGNPVSKVLANRSAKKYIEENFSNMNLEINKATYDFKSGGYHVFVNSPNSIDTHFSLSISLTGKVLRDSYEDYVLDKFNTWNRVNMEYRKMVDGVFESQDFPYESSIDYGDLRLMEKGSSIPFSPAFGLSLDELEIDKIYDIKELGEKVGHIVLYIYIEDEKIDAESASKILLHIKDIFDNKDIPFYAIDLTLEEPKTVDGKRYEDIKRFDVRDFLYKDIHEKDLIQRLQKSSEDLDDYYKEQDSKKKDY